MDFFSGLITDACFCFVRILVVETIFLYVNQVFGWTRAHYLIFFGTSFLAEGIYMLLFFNSHIKIPQQVETGELDYILSRPTANSIFLMSMQSINFGSGLANAILGCVYLYLGCNALYLSISVITIAMYILTLLCGALIYFALAFIINITSFWFLQVQNIFNIFMGVSDLYRYPGDIFPKPINTLITFVIPLQFISIMPARVLIEGVKLKNLIVLPAALIMICLSKFIYAKAKKSYKSARG
jgi:ABC-2 type transport system permease protein